MLQKKNNPAPQHPITGYHRDEENHWVAELACGHHQHVRHAPPWQNRPWVTTASGRQAMLGHRLACVRCLHGEPPQQRTVPEGTPEPAQQG